MRPRPEPQRTCVGCRQLKSKRMLVRLVARDGKVEGDPKSVKPGRGAYLCREEACWELATKRRSLERALQLRLTAEDWQRLRAGILT